MTAFPHVDRGHRLGTSTHNCALKLSLEPPEVADVPTDQRLHAGRSEVVPERVWSGRSAVTKGIGVSAACGVVPSDPVGDGINDLEVVRKCTGSDLVVVSWVAPSTEPARRGIVEDCCIEEVGAGIWQVEASAQPKTYRIADGLQLTQCPVPVWKSTRVLAFGPQREVEIVEVGTVPRQEETGEMNLRVKRVRSNPDRHEHFTRSGNLIRNTHPRVQIHVGVNKIWWRTILRKNHCQRETQRTVEVGAGGVHGGDQCDSHVAGGLQCRLMGDLL